MRTVSLKIVDFSLNSRKISFTITITNASMTKQKSKLKSRRTILRILLQQPCDDLILFDKKLHNAVNRVKRIASDTQVDELIGLLAQI